MTVLVDPVQWATEITKKIRDEISQVKTIGFAEVKVVTNKPGGGYSATVLLPGATTTTKALNCLSSYVPKAGDWATLVYPPGADPVLIGASPVAGSSPNFVDPDKYLPKTGGTVGTLMMDDDGGEKQIKSTASNAGFFFKNGEVGMYDWKNSRLVFKYSQSGDILDVQRKISGKTMELTGNAKVDSLTVDNAATVGLMTVKANDASLILDEREAAGGIMAKIASANGKLEIGYWTGSSWQYDPIWLDPKTGGHIKAEKFSGKYGEIIGTYDNWLRINELGTQTNGIYFGSSLVRTDGELQVGNAGATMKVNSSVFRAFGDYVMIGITGSTKMVYTASTRLQCDISYSFPKTPRLTASPRWQSGNVSLDVCGTLYVENVSSTGARISMTNDKGGGNFVNGNELWVDWHAVYIM